LCDAKGGLDLNIGAAVFYSLDNENSNKLYVYPKFNASYKVVGDLMIFMPVLKETRAEFMDFAMRIYTYLQR
jgi:hypothetical protein